MLPEILAGCSTSSTRKSRPAPSFTLSAAGEEDFSVLLDNDDYPPAEPGEIALLDAELTLPESIPIDPPTVVDDTEHFARLAAIAHRPAWLDALAAFYA